MKPTDLMIGDWVQYTYTPDEQNEPRTIVFQVSEIEYFSGAGLYFAWSVKYGRVCVVEKLQPIPLTAEILKKSGCIDTDGLFSIETGNEEFVDAEIYEKSESMWVLHTYDVEFGVINNMLHVAFVHELQNALRLCGIENEIVL